MFFAYPPFEASRRLKNAARYLPLMRRGERGDAVGIVQSSLVKLGIPLRNSIRPNGLPDGIFGYDTYRALKRFQTDLDLAWKDGIVGPETLYKMDDLLTGGVAPKPPKPPAPPPKPAPPTDRHYRIGSINPPIRHDAGAGKFNSKEAELTYKVLKQSILTGLPVASSTIGGNAAKHLKHYFEENGKTLSIDLEDMIRNVPSATRRFGEEAGQAKAFVEKLSVGKHRITSSRTQGGYNRKEESSDWYFAIGGYASWGTGIAHVQETDEGREYILQFRYHFKDRYNWDGGKQVEIGGVVVTDKFMGEFHRQGLAKEYDCIGSVGRTFRWKHGESIPYSQFF